MKNIVRNIDREMWVIIVLLSVILLLWFTNFQLGQNLYTNSINMNTINARIHQYSLENDVLRMELLQKESYTQIASEAASMGFIPAPVIH